MSKIKYLSSVKRLRQLAKQARVNINNGHNRIEMLLQNLNFQNFGDRNPEIVVTNDPQEYDIALWRNDVLYDIEDVIQEYGKYGIITPLVLTNMLVNNQE